MLDNLPLTSEAMAKGNNANLFDIALITRQYLGIPCFLPVNR